MGRIKNQRFEDLTGKKFNSLKVLSFNKNQKGTTYWNCECECGNLIVTRGSSLKSGYKKSCGHEKNKLPKDIEYIGETDESYSNGEKKRVYRNKKTNTVFVSSNYRVKKGTGTGYMRSDDNREKAKISPLLRNNGNNTDKYRGVSQPRGKKWVARIMVNRKNLYLGSFPTKEEAIQARLEAEEKYFKPVLEKYKKSEEIN